MLMLTELMDPTAATGYIRFRSRLRKVESVTPVASKTGCRDCGTLSASRRARGQGTELPLPERRHSRREQLTPPREPAFGLVDD